MKTLSRRKCSLTLSASMSSVLRLTLILMYCGLLLSCLMESCESVYIVSAKGKAHTSRTTGKKSKLNSSSSTNEIKGNSNNNNNSNNTAKKKLTELSVINDENDFYAILGLEKEGEDATEREIKQAWRTLSKQYHPDLAGEEVRSHYQLIQRAYEILGDRRKRKVYDILGLDGVKKLEQPQSLQQQQNLNPFFHLFGGNNMMQSADRGPDVHLTLLVPLRDVYTGAAHSVTLPKVKLCKSCRGTGARSEQDIIACPHCHGQGKIIQRVQIALGFVTNLEQTCPHCKGTGKHIVHECPVCHGRKTVKGEMHISVDVEAGMPDGAQLTYELEGDQHPGQVPGDVIFTLQTVPHPRYSREGNDLRTQVHLTLKEALLGFDRQLRHLDGHKLELKYDGITNHNTTRVVANEGMPKHNVPSEKGNLHVTYLVDLPVTLTASQRSIIEHLF